MFETILTDLRRGVRPIGRNPLFAATAVLSLAIGIGADTTVLTLANGLLLQAPAGIATADRLVDISEANADPFGVNEISFLNYVDMRRRATTLEAMYGYAPVSEPMSLADQGGAERVYGHKVTSSYFAVLGIRAAIGRLFDAANSDPAESQTVVLSHSF